MVKNHDVRWAERFEEYRGFVEREHRFPRATCSDGAELRMGQWITAQRRAFRAGTLSGERIGLLNGVHPGWHGSQVEIQASNREILARSDWERKVPAGEFPLDFVLDGDDLFFCLKNGIYSCEGLLMRDCKELGLQEARGEAFAFLFPNLDFNCSMLLLGLRDSRRYTEREFVRQLRVEDVEYLKRLSCNSEYISSQDMQDKVGEMLELLDSKNPKFKEILCMHYGLEGASPCSIDEISKRTGHSQASLWRTEANAFSKLEKRDSAYQHVLEKGLSAAAYKNSSFVERAGSFQIEDYRTVKVEELDLSPRSLNALHRAELDYVGDILDKADFADNKPFQFLAELPGLGGKSYLEVVDKVNGFLSVPDGNFENQKMFRSIMDNSDFFHALFPNLDYDCTKFLVRVSGEQSLEFLGALSHNCGYLTPEGMREKVGAVLGDCLVARSKKCVSLCFGLDGSSPLDITKVSEIVRVPLADVKQIMDKVMADLRQPENLKPLKEGLTLKEYGRKQRILYGESLYQKIEKYGEKLGYDSLPLEELGLSVATYERLQNAGYVDAVDVLDKIDFGSDAPYQKLFESCWLGKDGEQEIIEKFEDGQQLFGRVYYPKNERSVVGMIAEASLRAGGVIEGSKILENVLNR